MLSLGRLVILWCLTKGAALPTFVGGTIEDADVTHHPLMDILQVTLPETRSVIVIRDVRSSFLSSHVLKALSNDHQLQGMGVLEVPSEEEFENGTDTRMGRLLQEAAAFRKLCVPSIVVVFSEDIWFLKSFADESKKQHLMNWSTRMIVVTKVNHDHLKELIQQYWTFSFMNTAFINAEKSTERWTIMSYLPYSDNGNYNINLTIISMKTKSRFLLSKDMLFPDKYSNFNGATINVTSLPFHPYWIEEEQIQANGARKKVISGTDGLLLHAVAESLNFTFYVLPVESWSDVLVKVETYEAYISPIIWALMPGRLKRFDMSKVYAYGPMVFAMMKPPLKPQWQSLYHPLNNEVWLCTLLCVFLTPGFLYMIGVYIKLGRETYTLDMAIMEIMGTLMSQNLTHQLPKSNSGRILMIFWLLLVFILGTAYRGNLTANLTLPKYPPRAETMEELFDSVDLISGEAFTSEYKEFFTNSDVHIFREIGKKIETGPSVSDGLNLAASNRRIAVMNELKYLEYNLVKQFTKRDGTSDMYIGKTQMYPGKSAWPVIHGAPFITNIEKYMQAIITAGLYDKWNTDLIEKSRRESIQRQKNLTRNDDSTRSETQALTLNHIQGPIFLLILGLFIGASLFFIEKTYKRIEKD